MVTDQSLSLVGRVALITGGTRGIGLAVARLLGRRGADLILTGRDLARGRAAVDAVGGRFIQADASDPDTPRVLHDCLGGPGGRLDILVNNAGDLGEPANVLETTPEGFDATVGVHLKAPWMVLSTLAPLMARGGSIVNIASVAGHRVGATSAAYSVAKAGLIHLTRCAAAELGPRGIRVNSVSPGFVMTDIHAQALAPDDPRADKFAAGLERIFRQRQALDRLGAPVDVAELVAFLASDAAAFVSGSDFVADGGLMWGRSLL